MTPRHDTATVLVVDDDPDVRDLVAATLQGDGREVLVAADGREAMRLAYAERPDAIVLDVAMPELDGWQALERIRDLSDVPVLMLTANDTELDKVRGLRSGADDYVTKPFSRAELAARVDALLRRRGEGPDRAEIYEDAWLTVDFEQRSVHAGGVAIAVTPTEFKLLAAFVRHPNQVLSRKQLLAIVWNDPGVANGDQVKLYVGYLRRKLAAAGVETPIETVRGFGYRYRPVGESSRSPVSA